MSLATLACIIPTGCTMHADADDKPPPKPALKDTFKPADAEAAVRAANTFGIELYRRAGADGEPNLFLSPYSVAVALAMTAEGARDDTLREMAEVLHVIESEADRGAALERLAGIHAGYAALAKHFEAASGDADPATRRKIQSLRDKLSEANTRAEFKSKLGKYREAQEDVEQAEKLADELNALLATVDRYELRIANALWVEKTFPLLDSYTRTIDRFYGSGLARALDFRNQSEAARKEINAWVEKQTADRIKDLIAPGSLPPATSLVLTNAVYFLGQWSEPFERNMTREQDFTLAGGNKKRVQMMQDPFRKELHYAAFSGEGEYFDTPREVPKDESKRPTTYPGNGGFQMISLPYKGGEMSMVLLLPRTADGLAALESKLTAANLDEWIARMTPWTVDLKMPRFKLEGAFKLGETLQAMGMKRAFVSPDRPGGAQFTGMSSSPEATKQLFIGEVLHKAWIDVTEEGTEAAAATAGVMLAGAAMQPVEMVPFIPKFHADRPYLFLIRDAKSGTILFLGRMGSPV